MKGVTLHPPKTSLSIAAELDPRFVCQSQGRFSADVVGTGQAVIQKQE